MPNKENKGKIVISILVILVLGITGMWVMTERKIPVLDTKAAKKLIANFEKICRTTRDAIECKKIVGEGHTKCLLASASQNDIDGVVYSKEIYFACLEKKPTPPEK